MAKKTKRSYRRVRAKIHRHKQGIASKVTSGIAILLGISPVLGEAKREFVDGLKNPQVFAMRTAKLYVPYDFEANKFDTSGVVIGYGMVAGGIGFKWAMSQLLKRARL